MKKRTDPRKKFAPRRLVADFDGFNPPPPGAFYWVTPVNLSPSGVAFRSNFPPRFDQINIFLKNDLCVAARVVRVTRSVDKTGEPFEIACEFLTNLAYPGTVAVASSDGLLDYLLEWSCPSAAPTSPTAGMNE